MARNRTLKDFAPLALLGLPGVGLICALAVASACSEQLASNPLPPLEAGTDAAADAPKDGTGEGGGDGAKTDGPSEAATTDAGADVHADVTTTETGTDAGTDATGTDASDAGTD